MPESEGGLFEGGISSGVVYTERTTERHINSRRIKPIDTPVENIWLTTELASRRAAVAGVATFGPENRDDTNQRG